MASKKPDHHEIPYFYLKGFCVKKDSHLWVFQREKPFNPGNSNYKNNPYRAGLRKIALRADGYAVVRAGQPPDYAYETKLQREEHKADKTIIAIRKLESLDINNKNILAHYIGLMYKRLERRDAVRRRYLKETLDTYNWDKLQRDLAFAGRFRDALKVPEIKARFYTDVEQTTLLRENMITPFDDTHKALLAMRWCFKEAPEDTYFLTSDNPIMFDENKGLQVSPLFFPISHRIALLARWQTGPDLVYEVASIEEMRKLNSLTVLTATREVYSPKPEQWISDLWKHGFERRVTPE